MLSYLVCYTIVTKHEEELTVKYDCTNEFDLNEIYRKLTAPSKPQMVKASEFFRPKSFTLAHFQKQLATMVVVSNAK